MIKRKKHFVIQATTAAIVSLGLATACKHAPEKSAPPSSTAPMAVKDSDRGNYTSESEGQALTQRVSEEAQASYVTELEFKKGTDELTDAAKDKLNNLLKAARNNGRVDEVKILSWADQEYPSAKQKKLSNAP